MSTDDVDSNTSHFIIYQNDDAGADQRLSDLSQLAHPQSDKTRKHD
jgi:hypothetical protein